jgi:hypothetical protein
MARIGRLSNEATLDTLLQVCEALIEAHAAGVVHRDLKPGNLFFARDGSGAEALRVLDFGISRNVGRAKALTLVGAGLGSPSYMAPEQIEGSAAIDHRADIWTLGVVAYEMLTGVLPFEGEGIAEICARVMHQEREPITRLRTNAWPGLVGFVDRCLRLRPSERFSDAHAARATLRRVKAPARIPSVIITPERELDATPSAAIVLPARVAVRRSRARLSVGLGICALAVFVGWLVWMKPERALALGELARTPSTLQSGPPASAVRGLDPPSLASVVRARATAPPATKKGPAFVAPFTQPRPKDGGIRERADAASASDESENPFSE